MPTGEDGMVRQPRLGRARAPRREVFGMQPYPLDRPENRNRSLGREWVSRALVHTLPCLAGLLVLVVPLSGCTHFTEYFHNGFKVGPNYCRPPAPVAENWIDAIDV